MTNYTLSSTRPGKHAPILYEKELNPQQLDVVMAGRGPMLVIAGAGSGKTRTVTYRVARLVDTGTDPLRILLVTFTNKASREMLRRVETLLSLPTRTMWGGTFHHIGNMVLRKHAHRLGFQNSYSILDKEDARDLLSSLMTDMNIDTTSKRFPLADVIDTIIGLALNTGRSIEDIILDRFPHFWDRTDTIMAIASQYAGKKKKLNCMDFDDLLTHWRTLLQTVPGLKKEYGERFEHILVDEYQDTNRLQADIMDLLAESHRNIMVVGDDSQSIYSFRGANFENIMDFPRRYADAAVYRLEINYRSTPEILALANHSIRFNGRQFPKSLRAMRGGRDKPALVPLRDEGQQAEFIAQRVLELRDGGIPLSEMAVLYRSHYQSMEVQMELTRRDIPFEIRSGLRFFEQAHIKDVVAFLRILHNPSDELGWKRAIKLFRGIGSATADTLWEFAQTGDPLSIIRTPDALALVPSRGKEGWKKFLAILQHLCADSVKDNPAAMIDIILMDYYREYIQDRWPDSDYRLDDLEQLKNYASRFTALDTLLSDLALLTDMSGEEHDAGPDREDSLVLSTIHQAKGLEWNQVFLLSVCEGKFPSVRSLTDPNGEEEERRLFYVGVTRAKDGLYFCYPYLSMQKGKSIIQRPSRFLKELPEDSFERWNINEFSQVE